MPGGFFVFLRQNAPKSSQKICLFRRNVVILPVLRIYYHSFRIEDIKSLYRCLLPWVRLNGPQRIVVNKSQQRVGGHRYFCPHAKNHDMVMLTKTSSQEELKAYFCEVLRLSQQVDTEFPVDFDQVWPLVYSHRGDAARKDAEGKQTPCSVKPCQANRKLLPGYMTVRQYARKSGASVDLACAVKIGMLASALCRVRGLQTPMAPRRKVRIYPQDILSQVFKSANI